MRIPIVTLRHRQNRGCCSQYVSMLWNSLGVVVVVVLLPLLAKTHQSAEYVFTHFETDNAHRVGVQNPWWVAATGRSAPFVINIINVFYHQYVL